MWSLLLGGVCQDAAGLESEFTSLIAMIWPLAFFTFLSFRRKYLHSGSCAERSTPLLLLLPLAVSRPFDTARLPWGDT